MANVSRSTEVRGYLSSNSAAKQNPAFSAQDLYYDPGATPNWVDASGLQTRTEQQRERFIATMETFKQRYPTTRDSGIDIRDSHNWHEVLSVALSSQQDYNAKSKGVKGFFSRSARNIADVSPAITTILDKALPDGDYSSIVSGAVILVFKAFGVYAEVRDMVVKTLSDSPPLLETVERLLEIYPDRYTLKAAAAEVHLALLATITGIVEWLQKQSWRRLSAIYLQDLYENQLKDQIKALKESTEKMRTEADLCNKEKTHEIFKLINSVQLDTNLLLTQQTQLLLATGEISDGVTNMDDKMTNKFNIVGTTLTNVHSGVQDVNSEVHDFRGDVNQRFEDQNQKLNDAQNILQLLLSRVNVVNGLSQQLQHLNVDWLVQQTAATLLRTNSTPNLTVEDVVRLLGDWSQHNNSLIHYYSAVASDAGPRIAASITMSPQLKTWFASAASHLLFVDYDLVDEQIQPGSFVTSALCQALAQMRPATYLVHFSCQKSPFDCGNPVSNLMACLVSGLLRNHSVDLNSWADSHARTFHETQLQSRDLQYLCSLFKYLVRSLQSGVIFCLIDDFKELESESDPTSLLLAFRYIQDLVVACSQSGSVVFKVLIMTTSQESIVNAEIRSGVYTWLRIEAGNDGDVGIDDSIGELQVARHMYA